MPKQFIRLTGEQTMLQQTLARTRGLQTKAPVVVCNNEHRFIVAEQAREAEFELESIMLEPFGRNTAPAIALVAMQQLARNEDPLLLVLPSDHLIDDDERFVELIQQGAEVAADDQLVTFGIVPTGPETGFGYIDAGGALSADEKAFRVSRFVEKPDQKTAEEFIAAGNFYWNSGMFIFKASVYLEELKASRPDIYEACEQAADAMEKDADFDRVPADVFQACPDESIDYAVMEKTARAAVVLSTLGGTILALGPPCGRLKEKMRRATFVSAMWSLRVQKTHTSAVKPGWLQRWAYRMWSLLKPKTPYWSPTRIPCKTLRKSFSRSKTVIETSIMPMSRSIGLGGIMNPLTKAIASRLNALP
jgi:mannose-1-phosphate guanylyltransferase